MFAVDFYRRSQGWMQLFRKTWTGEIRIRMIFLQPTGKTDKWTILLQVVGENRAADPDEFRRENDPTVQVFRNSCGQPRLRL